MNPDKVINRLLHRMKSCELGTQDKYLAEYEISWDTPGSRDMPEISDKSFQVSTV